MNNNKKQRKERRRDKIRSQITGTKKRPRLSVFKSNTGVFLQIINDEAGKTLASVNSREIKKTKDINKEFAAGKLLAEKAKQVKVSEVVFDRGGNKYHGRIKSVAEGARAGGLKF